MNLIREYACVNGQIILLEDAKVSVLNAATQFGYGLFETLRTVQGDFVKWDKHYVRLQNSCRILGINIPFTAESGLLQLSSLQKSYLEQGDNNDAIYRITVTPSSILNWNISNSSEVIITRRNLPINLADNQINGVTAAILKTKRFPICMNDLRFKTTNSLDIILARNEMKQYYPNAYEGIFLTDNNNLIEGTVSNIFIITEEDNQLVLYTPPQEDGPLLGIMRQAIIELATKSNIKVYQKSINIDMLVAEQELFFTNSVQEIIPIKQIIRDDKILYKSNKSNFPLITKHLMSKLRLVL